MNLTDFEDWLYGKMSKTTVEETVRKIKFFEKQVDLNSREAIMEFLRQQRRNGAMAKRVNEYIKILNRWLEFSNQEKIEYLKERRSFSVKYYDEHQINSILPKIGTSTVEDRRNRAMVILALNTGLRRAEIADLRVDDVHENSILVRRGKGEKSRVVYMDPHTRSELMSYLSKRNNPNSPYLFTTKRGKVTEKYMGKIASEITKRTGVHFSWHKCRHTYAKTLLRSGVDLETIRIMLGHENLGTTQIYTVLGADEALERMAKTDVKFVKMEKGFETIKPRTFSDGLEGI